MDSERYGIRWDELPEWMRPRQRGVDFALLAVIMLGVIVAWPWINRSGIPNTLNAHQQIYRIDEVADSYQQGIVYGRWASRYHFSYGSPLFNYLAPVPHYIGGLHLLLAQSGAYMSFKFMMIAATFMAGVGMFAFARRRWGVATGFFASLTYLLAPPLLLDMPYLRADLPTMLAAGFFPFVLWAADRTFETGDGRNIALVAVFSAFLIMSDNMLGVIFFAMATIWILWASIWEKFRIPAMLGLLAGIGIALFYWLPALAEWPAVRWIEWEDHPQRLANVLGGAAQQDFLVFNPQPNGQIGLATWGLAFVGGVILLNELRNPSKRRASLVSLPFLVMGLIVLYVATSLPSTWLDAQNTFPVLSRGQLLVPVVACFALVAGQSARAINDYVRQPILKRVGWALLTFVVIGSAYPTIKPPPFVAYRVDDVRDHHLQAELQGNFSGSMLNGQLLPVDVRQMPNPSFYLLDSYANEQVSKLDRTVLLPRTGISPVSHTPVEDTFEITGTDARLLPVLTFNHVGWQARLEDTDVPIASAPDTGLIVLSLPEATGTLTVQLGLTIWQAIGMVGTTATFIMLMVLLSARRAKLVPRPVSPNTRTALVLSLIAIASIGVLRDQMPTEPAVRTMQPLPIVFEEGVDLLGYRSGVLVEGEAVPITFYWEANRPNLPNYRIRLSILDAQGQVRFVQTHRAPGGWPTSLWPLNRYIADTYWVTVPEGAAQVVLDVLRCDPLSPLYGCDDPSSLDAYEPRGQRIGNPVVVPLEIR